MRVVIFGSDITTDRIVQYASAVRYTTDAQNGNLLLFNGAGKLIGTHHRWDAVIVEGGIAK